MGRAALARRMSPAPERKPTGFSISFAGYKKRTRIAMVAVFDKGYPGFVKWKRKVL
jgi:hypothetical protein